MADAQQRQSHSCLSKLRIYSTWRCKPAMIASRAFYCVARICSLADDGLAISARIQCRSISNQKLASPMLNFGLAAGGVSPYDLRCFQQSSTTELIYSN